MIFGLSGSGLPRIRTLVSTGLTDTASILTSRSRPAGVGRATSTSTSESGWSIGSERWKPTAFMSKSSVRSIRPRRRRQPDIGRRAHEQRIVDRLDRAAFGLDAEQRVGEAGEREPGTEIEERRHDGVKRDLGLDDVGRADDEGQA